MANSLSFLAAVFVAAGLLPPTAGDDGAAAVAKCVSVAGALLQRAKGKAWQPVHPGGEVRAGELLVALPYADLRSQDGAVELMLLADAGRRGPYPVLEAAVRLQRDPARDLDVTLDRGIIGFGNNKQGAAKIRLHVAGASWDLILSEPGTQVGLERYSRHAPGLPVLKQGQVGPPTTEVVFLVKRGSAFLNLGTKGYRLLAPPGPARLRWDSVSQEVEIQHLDKLPPSLLTRNAKEEKIYQAICAAAARLNRGPVGPTLEALIHADEPVARRSGVTAAGALDDLPLLVGALADPKHADVRAQAVLVLRHWMGRGPGQVGKLHAFLKGPGGYPATRARTVIQLLFGFNDKERLEPDTYAVLVDLLGSPGLPVRELAWWHLVRLVPQGKDISYDAAASPAARQRALEQWRALIPRGQLPSRGPAATPAKK